MEEDTVGDYAISGASASMCSPISLSLFTKQTQHSFRMLFLPDTHQPRFSLHTLYVHSLHLKFMISLLWNGL